MSDHAEKMRDAGGTVLQLSIPSQVNIELPGNAAKSISVTLTESSLMRPLKSVSGILFPCDEAFVSCSRCARDKCAGRRAPYERHLTAVASDMKR